LNAYAKEGVAMAVDNTDGTIDPATNEDAKQEKNPAAVALGRLGGKKGGPARAAKLTPEQRKEIAKKAAAARWNRDVGELATVQS